MTAARPRIPFQTEQYHSESSETYSIETDLHWQRTVAHIATAAVCAE